MRGEREEGMGGESSGDCGRPVLVWAMSVRRGLVCESVREGGGRRRVLKLLTSWW